MDKFKSALIKVKDVAKNNAVAIAAGAVAIGAIALQQRNNRMFQNFLTEKGIDHDEYYNPESYEEKLKME
jgi:hypothetical protein